MKQILIVEPDEHFAARLFEALLDAGDYQISSTPAVRQACLIVAQQTQDLAFVPLEGVGGTMAALRRLQPDLPLVVTVPRAEVTLPAPYARQVQAVLPRPALALGLADFMDKVWAQAVPERQGEDPAAEGAVNGENGALLPLLQGSALPETMLAVLVSQGANLLAHAGTLSREQAQRVAERVSQTWMPGLTAQVQFMLLPSRTSDLQLYSRPAGNDCLLTLVARPETRMEAFRAEANRLVQQVADVVGRATGRQRAIALSAREPGAEAATEKTYTLVWRSLAPLPQPLRIALGRGLERTATENGCVLSYLAVEENLVHLVVRCPPGRSSAWVAHLFKREAEAAIQTQFEVEKHLWERGYFAAERAEPLSEVELDLILSRPRKG